MKILIIPDFLIFSISFLFGILPCLLWGKIGGDEPIIDKHPEWAGTLKLIHHWWIGIIIIILGLFFTHPFNTIVFGWGLGTAVDDSLFHSFECYFERKEC